MLIWLKLKISFSAFSPWCALVNWIHVILFSIKQFGLVKTTTSFLFIGILSKKQRNIFTTFFLQHKKYFEVKYICFLCFYSKLYFLVLHIWQSKKFFLYFLVQSPSFATKKTFYQVLRGINSFWLLNSFNISSKL